MIRFPVDALRPGMVVARTMLNDKGDILLARGTRLTPALIQLLSRRGYIHLDIMEANEPIVECEMVSTQVRSVTQRHIHALAELAQRSPGGRGAWRMVDFNRLKADVQAIVDSCLTRGSVDGLLVLRSYDDFTFAHSVDVAVTSVLLGKQIGIERDALFELALGGLLHDIGKLEVPRSLLMKPGRLTPEELTIVRRHAEAGFEMLEELSDVPLAPKLVVRQHHERQDGRGYGEGRRGTNRIWRPENEHLDGVHIHLLAEIVAVVEVYTSLSSDLPYRKAFPADEVQRILVEQAGSHLNREIVQRFLGMVAAFPLGSDVVVRGGPYSGWRGIVISVPPDATTRPTIRLHRSSTGDLVQEGIELVTADLPDVELSTYVPLSPLPRASAIADKQ